MVEYMVKRLHRLLWTPTELAQLRKKHSCVGEGWDISPPILGILIEFNNRTVTAQTTQQITSLNCVSFFEEDGYVLTKATVVHPMLIGRMWWWQQQQWCWCHGIDCHPLYPILSGSAENQGQVADAVAGSAVVRVTAIIEAVGARLPCTLRFWMS